MKNLNGFQLHQQIKAIDPTIKFLFVTALDILDELLIIVPGLSTEQIMRKPVDKVIFINTVKKTVKSIKQIFVSIITNSKKSTLTFYIIYKY